MLNDRSRRRSSEEETAPELLRSKVLKADRKPSSMGRDSWYRAVDMLCRIEAAPAALAGTQNDLGVLGVLGVEVVSTSLKLLGSTRIREFASPPLRNQTPHNLKIHPNAASRDR